jgi:hypothetical protein
MYQSSNQGYEKVRNSKNCAGALMTRSSILKKLILSLTFFACCAGSFAFGQVAPAATSGSGLNAFASFGGQKTRVIDFNFNSLGFDGGLYIQPRPLLGIEARAAKFSLYARYSQMPVTAGYRAEIRRRRTLLISGYGGGGMSLAQDAGPHYVATAAEWSPCWQVSQSTAIDFGRFKWKAYEATFTDTYTTRRSLPAFTLTTGIIYSFSPNRR